MLALILAAACTMGHVPTSTASEEVCIGLCAEYRDEMIEQKHTVADQMLVIEQLRRDRTVMLSLVSQYVIERRTVEQALLEQCPSRVTPALGAFGLGVLAGAGAAGYVCAQSHGGP